MKLNYISMPLGTLQVASTQIITPSAPIILLILLTVARIAISEYSNDNNQHATVLDEEISLDPVGDYDHRSQVSSSDAPHTTKHDNQAKAASNYHEEQRLPSNTSPDDNDPFAVTFEDYLKEWFTNGSNHRVSDHHVSDSSRQHEHGTEESKPADLIIEDEENLVKPELPASKIDYIFPPPKHDSTHNHNQNERAELIKRQDNKLEVASNSERDEIKLLFGWKQLPTNKCSKTCGKGLRIYHLSCIDLKFNVRVQDELCHQSNLPRPSETSDEPCNEIDCPAEWLSIESHRCDFSTSNVDCKPKLYKRAQCSMISKTGSLVYLDESKCNSTLSSLVVEKEARSEGVKNESTKESEMKEESADSNSEELSLDGENNDIVANIDPVGSYESLLSKSSRNRDAPGQDEPYFFAGNWSECHGATCGQVGKRTRRVSCRLYLSRSSKTTDLPMDSCSGQTPPFSEEPCYMHCPEELKNQTSPSVQIFDHDGDAETIYDMEMTRFIWKIGGWTKCSTDCLGGRRESIIECWDKTTGTVDDPSNCEPDLKPQVVIETCNDIPCPAEWRVGSWSRCSKHCGSAGTRTRPVSCVQQVPLREGITYMIVSNDLCISVNSSVPASIDHCNRVDCKPEWSVGPWSDCNRKCGEGARNRTLICVQEFANKDGPKFSSSHLRTPKRPDADLLEAIAIGAKNWHPGKAVQVPFEVCFEEYKTAPSLEDRCFNICDKEPYIDADLQQDYRMSQEFTKKKTVTLKIGGRAQILEGRNLKIRCRILNRQRNDNLVTKVLDQVEWRKDGVKIFMNNSTVADKQYFPDDNLIFGRDLYFDEKNQYLADEPKHKRTSTQTQPRTRHLSTRSWNHHHGLETDSNSSYNFIPQPGGRFALVRENTLRIKKLRHDDSGTYTCLYGSLSESINLKVTSRRDLSTLDDIESQNF